MKLINKKVFLLILIFAVVYYSGDLLISFRLALKDTANEIVMLLKSINKVRVYVPGSLYCFNVDKNYNVDLGLAKNKLVIFLDGKSMQQVNDEIINYRNIMHDD